MASSRHRRQNTFKTISGPPLCRLREPRNDIPVEVEFLDGCASENRAEDNHQSFVLFHRDPKLLRRFFAEAERVESPDVPTVESRRPRAVAASILSERGPKASGFAKVAAWLAGVAIIVLIALAIVLMLTLWHEIQHVFGL